jgi:chromosome segregation protein
MRIKRVVIHGFKTFANRTEFIFDPGITAVVGPNGSGKSNIVDAIRWCLGEQSFSLLRSKKTSDVIFAGSDKRSRLGMAEVSILLDNSGGEIPIDFAEVEITRRAYRDGDNEYLVNGQRVRLQDVAELLAQTGLGRRTYAVIGQGLIDKVLSLTPEERRMLFEEAAGITGYQAKRETTLKRLEATQQNLARVRDIIAELSPRLGHLKRQAERAREREQIAADLHTLLRDWYGYRWHTTLTNVNCEQSETQRLKEAVNQRQGRLQQIAETIERLRGEQAALRNQLGDYHKQSSALHQQAENTGRDLAIIQERQRQLQNRQEEAQRELATLHLQSETLTARNQELQRGLISAQETHAQRLQAVTIIQRGLEQRQAERGRLQGVFEEMRRRQNEVRTRYAETNTRQQQTVERHEQLQRDRQQQEQKLEQARQNAANAQAALQQAEAQLAQQDQHSGELQYSLQKLRSAVESQRLQVQEMERKRQQADRDQDRLQTRYDLLRRLQREGAGYASGVRTVLQAGLPGVLGTVASLVRVPPELDKAIETALGGAFQYIITSRWAETQQAINLLKGSGRGRATFLPLDRLYSPTKLNAPKHPGLVGNAVDLVEYEATIKLAVEQLLNRVWVARDLHSARQLLDSWRDSQRPTLVTLDGEIIRPGGAVTGGSEGERHDESIFGCERELRTLPAQIETAQQQLQQWVAQCNEINRQLAANQAQIDKDQHLQVENNQRERRLRQQAEEQRRQQDRNQQALRWEEERLKQMLQELESLVERHRKLAAQLQELSQEQQQANEAVTQAESEASLAEIDSLLQQMADARAAAAEAQGHLRSQQTLQESQQRSLQSAQDQLKAKQERLETLRKEAVGLEQQMQTLAAAENELSQQIEALRQQIEPAELRLSQLETSQTKQEVEERSQQQELRKEEAQFTTTQLRLQRNEDILEQLRHEIQQDLGLVAIHENVGVDYQPPLPWDSYVEQLPVLTGIPDTLEGEVRATRIRLSRLSNVNPDAPREYEEAANRYEFLLSQSADLEAATTDLRRVIGELDELMKNELRRTFTSVAKQFGRFFQMLFNGGAAQLELTAPEDIAASGVEIIVRPPGKRAQSLALLSGGERALSACALIFAILYVSPTPFCVLDEVDAALDEANVDRLRQTIAALSQDTQFIVVTHNRRTLEGSSAIYGVTMGNDGISCVIGLRLEGDKIVQKDGVSAAEEKQQIETIEELVKM